MDEEWEYRLAFARWLGSSRHEAEAARAEVERAAARLAARARNRAGASPEPARTRAPDA